MLFELKINDLDLVNSNEQYSEVSEAEIEELCESIDVSNCRSFFIFLILYVFQILNSKILGRKDGVEYVETMEEQQFYQILDRIGKLKDKY